MVAAAFLPIAYNIIAENAALIIPRAKEYTNTPVIYTIGVKGYAAITSATRAEIAPVVR